MLVTRTSALSGITRTLEINVTEEQIALWKRGMLIQNAMPQLDHIDREFIMTGIIDSEWDEAFGEEV